MRSRLQHVLSAAVALMATTSGAAQTAAPVPSEWTVGNSAGITEAAAPQKLFEDEEPGLKFRVETLMLLLRDNRHEGWVLAAYPDPKTKRPLIGAGFSLDIEERQHQQSDPLNPHQFLEPSSAQLWQAAGLEPRRLDAILAQFDKNFSAWGKKGYRRKIKAGQLTPQITDQDATALLRVSVLQAVHNGRAYCRNFDQLTASQQMAISQLVYQMGVNLEEFTQFLVTINEGARLEPAALTTGVSESEREYWKQVQQTLISSQWARRYRSRAVNVIAMFDPEYGSNPVTAERQVQAVLHPPAKHRHKKRSANA